MYLLTYLFQVVLGDTSSPVPTMTKSKHSSSSSHRKSSGHASSTASVPAGTNRSSTGAGKPSTCAVPAATVDQSSAGVTNVKAKNVCVVEPQSSSKAMAVVAPLMAPEFAKLFGEPIVKSDVSRKQHHHKV